MMIDKLLAEKNIQIIIDCGYKARYPFGLDHRKAPTMANEFDPDLPQQFPAARGSRCEIDVFFAVHAGIRASAMST